MEVGPEPFDWTNMQSLLLQTVAPLRNEISVLQGKIAETEKNASQEVRQLTLQTSEAIKRVQDLCMQTQVQAAKESELIGDRFTKIEAQMAMMKTATALRQSSGDPWQGSGDPWQRGPSGTASASAAGSLTTSGNGTHRPIPADRPAADPWENDQMPPGFRIGSSGRNLVPLPRNQSVQRHKAAGSTTTVAGTTSTGGSTTAAGSKHRNGRGWHDRHWWLANGGWFHKGSRQRTTSTGGSTTAAGSTKAAGSTTSVAGTTSTGGSITAAGSTKAASSTTTVAGTTGFGGSTTAVGSTLS